MTPGAPLVAVVDDDRSVRRSIALMLACDGFETAEFSSGVDFLADEALVRSHCVVLDMLMPDMSGIEVLKCLEQRGASVPVVAVTGHDDTKLEATARACGASAYLFKPFASAALAAAVRGVLRPQAIAAA